MQEIPENEGMYEARREHDACGIGAVANISGKPDHAILEYGREIIENLQHRGAAGADESTGDGSGILFQLPHAFFTEEAAALGFDLPAAGSYGVAMVFLPPDANDGNRCRQVLGKAVTHYGMSVLGWRDVPGNRDCLGDIARASEPGIAQLFIDGNGAADPELERKLYLARRRAEQQVRTLGQTCKDFYICSLSCRTICYKGMFLAPQLFQYYPDLHDPRTASSLAVVHQRYSTNTFPSWQLAQPFRMVAHNGEINTLHGNINKIAALEHFFESPLLGDDLSDVVPVLTPGQSDSASFDNVFELLTMAGRSTPHAMMMMVPEAFGSHYHISTDKRAFYEYHAAIMEPWDGPAAMVFTDGRLLGGTLDRNGLRPCRWMITKDGLMVMASETGVIDFPPDRIQAKGRLQPGKMFLVDTGDGRVITDSEIKGRISRQKPYRRWLGENRIELKGVYVPVNRPEPARPDLLTRLKLFGYTREDLHTLLQPMAQNGQEPVGSMGNDVPLAVLSDQPKILFQYFKQMFAQVTNPPIDPLREGLVMSLMGFAGRQQNLLSESPEHCRQLKLPHPVLTNEEMQRLRHEAIDGFDIATVDALFDPDTTDPGGALIAGLDRLVKNAVAAIEKGTSMLIISDRGASATAVPIPSLMAIGTVHHGLLRRKLRARTGLIVETGEAREVHHFCMLGGYGAFAVNPYMAFEAIELLHGRGYLPGEWKRSRIVDNYVNAVKKGFLKTMSKMGISTLRSYRGAQLFECVGLDRSVVERCFSGSSSRIGGAGFSEIAQELLERHAGAFRSPKPGDLEMAYGGEYAYRVDGEQHAWNPDTVSLLQHAVRGNDPSAWDRYAETVNDQSRRLKTLRGLFAFTEKNQPVPIGEVEPAGDIIRRFCTGAMSHGSISREVHELLAAGMNAAGGMNNTGEGGEDPARYEPNADGWDLNSQIKQIASGRFGVTIDYLAHARVLQIKMAQGAKPGEGGQLPGHKVTDEIARLRHSTPGVSLISPPPHHDIYSIEDLAQLIYDLKCSNPGVGVSVKLVSEVGVGTIAAGVTKGHADEVLVSGHDGGTGASPLSSIKHAGCPWEMGLAETQQTLVLNGLRDRVRLQTDGGLKTGRDVVIAALLGAERFGFGTGALVSIGCIMMRKCHLGTCPVGVATQDPELRKRFRGKPQDIINFMTFIAEDVRNLMARLGFRKMDDMIGRVDLLETGQAIEHFKGKHLDLSGIFKVPDTSEGQALRCVREQSDLVATHKDWSILEQVGNALETKEPVTLNLDIANTDRTIGTILSNRIVNRHGAGGLPADTIRLNFRGAAGQSFGAFLAPGVTLNLTGDVNDYLGKGLSGGKIIVRTPPEADFVQYENIIAGNTLLYGATAGEVFVNGLAGERFAVRNSGATAVVEGVGDHGCEYMTGGVVVVLGTTGRNFAAGMSGGFAYVLDEHQLFDTRCNLDMVDLESVWRQEDIDLLRSLIERHQCYTGSQRAGFILDNWRHRIGRFVKVIPIDYRKAMQRLKAAETRETECIPATEEVYR